MQTMQTFKVDDTRDDIVKEAVKNALKEVLGDNEIAELEKESASGTDTSNYPVSAFKIEQKIIDIKSNSAMNVGGFVNGNANIRKFTTRYEVVLFSNKFETISDSVGNTIRKRYGYGFGFTLNVSDINTKLSFNFGIIAASAALDLARAQYSLNVNGVVDAQLAAFLPVNTGDFSHTTYKALQDFIKAAKNHLSSNPINQLYPIEILKQSTTQPEKSDSRSIYFGVKKVSEGVKLNDAIRESRNLALTTPINENIIQFVYNYFDIPDAYTEPTGTSKQNAAKWLEGKYNKVMQLGVSNDSWVAVDPAIENGKFVVLSGLADAADYQPHPLPSDWANMGKSLDDKFSYVSMDFSSSLKLSSILDLSGKFNSVNITRDISLYTDISTKGVAGKKVFETRYGVGLRLTLRISNVEFGTKINYGSVGATSEMGHAFVEYEIMGLGISDAKLLKDFPGPQDITVETMEKINKAFNNLKDKLAGMDVSKMQPQPYMIRVNEPDKVDPTLEAQAFVFCMNKIEDRTKLKTTIGEAESLGIKKEYIKNIYKEWCNITDEDDSPSRPQKLSARKWLDME